MKLYMPVTIQVIAKALFKIFNHDLDFAVPLYPRCYTRTTDQAGELLTDLFVAAGNDSQPILSTHPCFLGSIAIVRGEDAPDVDIVDGQQRLTILTILLAALRDTVPAEHAASLTACNYERGDLIAGMSDRYRLKLREGDAEFFRYFIGNEKGPAGILQLDGTQLTENQKNIQTHVKYFRGALAHLSEAQRLRLLQYLMLRCFLVSVAAPNIESAYHIFSILNARVQDLRLIDLVRSQMIGAVPGEKQETYSKLWQDEEEETFQELFAHIRLVYRKTKLRDTALTEYRKYVPPEKNPQKFIDNVLRPYSESLEIVKAASYSNDKGAWSINAMLGWLNQIDNFDWVAPAVLYLGQNRDAPDRLDRFFTDLERLAAGLMILRADVHYRLKRYGRLLSAIAEKVNLDSADSPLQLTSDEARHILKTLDGNLYLAKRIRRYVLLRLDAALAGRAAAYDHPVISVEHVLPQNPAAKSIWHKWFPAADDRSLRLQRIGNLVLLPRRKNAQAQNFDFDKMKTYFACGTGTSPFALTEHVLRHTEWTPAAIDERQKELLHRLKILWRL